MKRSISLALALIMVLSIFSGIRVSAENGYLYNTGKRGVVQTTPSQYAIDYYTDSYSYENLSELSPSDLRTALNNLIERDKVDASYASLVEYFPYTDADCENEGNIILFYCNLSQTAQWAPAKYWNREHMWPDSKGGSALEGDVHAMRPTDPDVNGSRGNLPYGEGHTGKPAYANEYNQGLLGGYFGGAFEPLDIAKGDCARTILYDYVAQTGVNVVDTIFESRETLLKWCQLDPVDQFEMSRNDSAQSIQKNRNPFVDYPELAWIILGEEVPTDLVSPNLGAVSYSITATSNNTAYGTVSVSGRRITAVPAEGYYAAGYTVLSGKATVTQSGNVFTVAAESDCEICINFEKKTVVTVSFNGAVDPISGYAGEPITLPEAAAEEGYRFIGWVDQPVQATTEQPSYYEAGGEYIPNGSVNLYPLYSYTEGGMGTGWSLVDQESDLYVGAKLIMTANTKGKVAGSLSNHVLTAATQSFGSDLSVLETASQEALTLVLGGEQGAWTLSNESGQALGATSAKNLSWGSGTQTWNITVSAEGAAITSTDGSCGKFLYNVSSPRFTTYTSGASSSMLLPQLYINDGGVLYFTTELSRCEHSNTSYTEAVAATCTAEGNPAYYTCTACGRSFADASCTEPLTGAQIAIPALGHEPGSYGKDAQTHWQLCSRCGEICTEVEAHEWDQGTVTQEPTEDKEGVTTYTCELCSATYTETIPALGQKLRASFSVPEGVEAVSAIYAFDGEEITLPEVVGTPGEEFSFLGWTTDVVDHQTSVGAYYRAGETYVLEDSISFKALYQYRESGTDDPETWNLLTDVAELSAGDQLILASNAKGKVAGALSSQYLTPLDATFAADYSVIEKLPADALILTLGGESGAWTFSNAKGQLLGATAVKKLAWDSGTTTWDITLENGDATVYSTTRDYGRFLYNHSSPRFTTYASSVNSNMLLPQLYILSGGSTVYYTTEFGTDTEEPEVPTEPAVDESITLGHSLNLASDISINYAVRTALLEKYDSYHLECVLPVYEGNTLTGSKTVQIQPVLKGSYYYFTLTGVTAVNMNDTITATLYMEQDGASFRSNSEEYSVAKYAYAQLAKTDVADKLKALCANLLRYGAAAQSFKSYRTDALVDQTMTAEDRAFLTDLDTVSFGNYNRDLGDLNAPVVLWVGKSLLLDSKVTLRYVFNAANFSGNVEELSLRVTYKDYKGETKTATVIGAQPYGETVGRYSFDFDGLLAAELRSVLHAAVYAGETQVSNTLEYSVDTYGNNKEGTLGALCKALIAYSDVALAYFA